MIGYANDEVMTFGNGWGNVTSDETVDGSEEPETAASPSGSTSLNER